MAVVWQSSSGGKVPCCAYKAGNDLTGPIYVARAWHQGDHIPGKLVPTYGAAFVSWGGYEHQKEQYEVLLCGHRFAWVNANACNPLPRNAIVGGMTSTGEPLYIGRVIHNGVDVCGKVQHSYQKCFIPYGGTEHAYDNHEVLVLN